MKNALILHGTDGNSQENWFPWLQAQLEKLGYQVWTPDLPQANKPNIKRYNRYIFANHDFQINKDTILIGHSSGAMAILGLLQAFPSDIYVKAAYLVGTFKNDLGWGSLSDLFIEPFDFKKIKSKSRLFYFIHSDNDPYCPLEHAQYLHNQIGGDLIVLPDQKHFSTGTFGEAYREFPYLLHLIAGDAMKAEDVISLYKALAKKDVKIWLDGGWGVDALLGKQTRPHGDVDIIIEKKNEEILKDLLISRGYREILRSDSRSYNYMLGNDEAQLIDIHVIELDKHGNGIYGPVENGVMYTSEALTGKGKIDNLSVNCTSPEWVVKSHTGYELRASDYHDVLAVCEKFGIELPEEYKAK